MAQKLPLTDEEYRIKRRLSARRSYWRRRDSERARKSTPEYLARANERRTPERAMAQSEYSKRRYRENPELFRDRQRAYYSTEKGKLSRAARLRKLREDPGYRIKENLSFRIRKVIKGASKSGSTIALTGCSHSELRSHIESQFKAGMTWENYGKIGWHIDHIIPCASFDLSNPDHQRKCFHFSNLQPLWYHENVSKGAKV